MSVPDPSIAQPTPQGFIAELGILLDRVKEFLLKFVGPCYLLGFLVSQCNATRYQLGLLNLIQPYYILAGLFPTLALFISFGFHRFIQKRFTWLDQLKAKVPTSRGNQIADVLGVILLGLVAFLVFFVIRYGYAEYTKLVMNPFIGTLLWAYLLTTSFFLSLPSGDPSAGGVLRIISGSAVIFSLGFLLFNYLFVTVFHLWLPQEWGGMHPRRARLGVTRLQLSPETREALLPPTSRKIPADPGKDTTPVVKTILLAVLFDAGDYLIVRPDEQKTILPNYRLKKDVVQDITWLGWSNPIPLH
ncbi:MAG: hypothetical protein QM758_03175 [Armatimonas sp.]